MVTVTGIPKDPAQRARDQKQRGALHFAVKAGEELCTLTMWRGDLEGMMMMMMMMMTGWWFQICFIVTPIWGRFPF